jgi:anaerobic magnesium-protoporphyrin IX monomethyl ester cyclase
MRLLLVNPPEEHLLSSTPTVLNEQRGAVPPLGLLYLAAYVERHSRHQVDLLDAAAERMSPAALGQAMRERRPDVVGIQALTFTLLDVLEVARQAKQLDPALPVVVGGPHTLIYPVETASLPAVDYVIQGEAETVLVHLLNHLERGGQPPPVPGLFFRDGPRVVGAGPAPVHEDLDQLPFPARHLARSARRAPLLGGGRTHTTMITSRGCPFGCAFCDRPQLARRWRMRSARSVVDEMQECVRQGYDDISVYDDTFSVHRGRVLDICQDIIARNLRFQWDIRARVDTMEPEMLEALRRAGVQRIHYGVEAGTTRSLQRLHKGVTLAQIARAFEMTRKAGIATLGYFMIGSPGETRQDVLATIRLARQLRADYAHFSIFTPYPATEFYQEGLAWGLFPTDYWRSFAQAPHADFVPPVWEEYLSRSEICRLLARAYRGFYFRPRCLLRQLAVVRSWTELRRKARAALQVAAG